MALIFASFGLGMMGAGLTFLALVLLFQNAIDRNIQNAQWVWRLLLLTGVIPAAVTAPLRFRMRAAEADIDSTDYPSTSAILQANIGLLSGDVQQDSGAHVENWKLEQHFLDFRRYMSRRSHIKTLIATAGSWFLLWV